MIGICMKITIISLFKQGKSKSEISRITGHDRKTVRKIINTYEKGSKGFVDKDIKHSKLDEHKEDIIKLLEKNLSGVRIYEELLRLGCKMSYPNVVRYIRGIKGKREICIRFHSESAEEGQVDFGYVGMHPDTANKTDFNFQPSIDKRLVSEAATCQYIKDKTNLVFIGNPGTGKSHLAVSLGIKALAKDYKVIFTSVSDMLHQLYMAKADNSYFKKLTDYLTPDLLILDELGFKKLPQHSADDFFEVISKRYERGSCIITTNKNFEQWGEIFGDGVLSSAILDRIVHHSITFKIIGPSYRAKTIKNKNSSEEKQMK